MREKRRKGGKNDVPRKRNEFALASLQDSQIYGEKAGHEVKNFLSK
jgi:hypothetical protein